MVNRCGVSPGGRRPGTRFPGGSFSFPTHPFWPQPSGWRKCVAVCPVSRCPKKKPLSARLSSAPPQPVGGRGRPAPPCRGPAGRAAAPRPWVRRRRPRCPSSGARPLPPPIRSSARGPSPPSRCRLRLPPIVLEKRCCCSLILSNCLLSNSGHRGLGQNDRLQLGEGGRGWRGRGAGDHGGCGRGDRPVTGNAALSDC